ncbi:acyltransferase family protein [Methylobacterium sp. P31]
MTKNNKARGDGKGAPEMPSRSSYMPQLDVLRAVAIGLVMLEHFGGPLVRRYFPLDPGALGVHLFFVLSGFLISSTILNSYHTRPNQPFSLLGNFYARRVLRLFPAYYLTLMVLIALGIPSACDWSAWHAAYLSNYIIIFGGPLVVFWSLAVEEQFYLLLPAGIILSGRNRVLNLGIALVFGGILCRIAAYGLSIPKAWFEFSLAGKLELLGFGVALGSLCCSEGMRNFDWLEGPRKRNFFLAAAFTLLFQLVVWTLEDDGPVRFLTFNITSACFLGFLVVWCASDSPGPVKFLRAIVRSASSAASAMAYIWCTHSCRKFLKSTPLND